MRILFVSYYFPPFNTIGAVRVGKMAKYLEDFGHDVRVIAADDQMLPPTLPVEINEDRVIRTPWWGPHRLAFRRRRANRHNAQAGASAPAGGPSPAAERLLDAARRVGRVFTVWDGLIGWYPYALREAVRLSGDWRPDLIYASAHPITSLRVGAAASRRIGVPWVAELRDLWADNHALKLRGWRRRLEERRERRCLTSAAGLVTATEAFAAVLRARYDQPVGVVLNGYDPGDFPSAPAPRPADGLLRVTYTGRVYTGKQDPTPLFAALAGLGPVADRVRLVFYGGDPGLPLRLGRQHGVERLVESHPSVPYRDALRLQSESDILLLLNWLSPEGWGVYFGKLFEYAGARRPILCVGPPEGSTAEFVRDRKLGVVAGDPQTIADQLRRWIDEKRERGWIPAPPPEAAAGLSREDQARALESFLRSLLPSGD
jgi:glycosyltransferase involved in cell wall biosynthesis